MGKRKKNNKKSRNNNNNNKVKIETSNRFPPKDTREEYIDICDTYEVGYSTGDGNYDLLLRRLAQEVTFQDDEQEKMKYVIKWYNNYMDGVVLPPDQLEDEIEDDERCSDNIVDCCSRLELLKETEFVDNLMKYDPNRVTLQSHCRRNLWTIIQMLVMADNERLRLSLYGYWHASVKLLEQDWELKTMERTDDDVIIECEQANGYDDHVVLTKETECDKNAEAREVIEDVACDEVEIISKNGEVEVEVKSVIEEAVAEVTAVAVKETIEGIIEEAIEIVQEGELKAETTEETAKENEEIGVESNLQMELTTSTVGMTFLESSIPSYKEMITDVDIVSNSSSISSEWARDRQWTWTWKRSRWKTKTKTKTRKKRIVNRKRRKTKRRRVRWKQKQKKTKSRTETERKLKNETAKQSQIVSSNAGSKRVECSSVGALLTNSSAANSHLLPRIMYNGYLSENAATPYSPFAFALHSHYTSLSWSTILKFQIINRITT